MEGWMAIKRLKGISVHNCKSWLASPKSIEQAIRKDKLETPGQEKSCRPQVRFASNQQTIATAMGRTSMFTSSKTT